jgi:hypothetical protein
MLVRQRLKRGCFRETETLQTPTHVPVQEYHTSAVILQVVNQNGFLVERLALPCHNLITSQE